MKTTRTELTALRGLYRAPALHLSKVNADVLASLRSKGLVTASGQLTDVGMRLGRCNVAASRTWNR